jgi:hypothetical protein
MGQLLMKFRTPNPGTIEIERLVELTDEEERQIQGRPLTEIFVDGERFILAKADDGNDKDK